MTQTSRECPGLYRFSLVLDILDIKMMFFILDILIFSFMMF